jgi:AbrB family looped-hinge helix DNA binding protein
MARTSISTRGQVVIPKETRDRCGWTPGTVLDVEEVDGVVHLRPVAAAVPFDPDAVFGCIRPRGPALSIEEMEASVAQMFRDEHGRH